MSRLTWTVDIGLLLVLGAIVTSPASAQFVSNQEHYGHLKSAEDSYYSAVHALAYFAVLRHRQAIASAAISCLNENPANQSYVVSIGVNQAEADDRDGSNRTLALVKGTCWRTSFLTQSAVWRLYDSMTSAREKLETLRELADTGLIHQSNESAYRELRALFWATQGVYRSYRCRSLIDNLAQSVRTGSPIPASVYDEPLPELAAQDELSLRLLVAYNLLSDRRLALHSIEPVPRLHDEAVDVLERARLTRRYYEVLCRVGRRSDALLAFKTAIDHSTAIEDRAKRTLVLAELHASHPQSRSLVRLVVLDEALRIPDERLKAEAMERYVAQALTKHRIDRAIEALGSFPVDEDRRRRLRQELNGRH